MKKEDASGLIIFALLLAIAVVFGLTVLRTYSINSKLPTGSFILLIVGSLLIGVVLNSIFVELFHALGAKVGRYSVISINILFFTFYKETNKWKFKFSQFDGLLGETKIYPKETTKKMSNPTPFLIFPTIFLGLETLILIFIFTILNTMFEPGTIQVNVAYSLLIIGVISAMILFYNIVPFKLDSKTDGYLLTTVSNSKNKEAFNELIKIEYEIAEGNNNVELKTFTTITEYTANLNLNKVYLLLDAKKFDEAETIIDIILAGQDALSYKTYIRTRCQKIYINLMSKTLEEAFTYYDENVPMDERREISADRSMPSIRTYLLMAGLLDKSRSECLIALNKVNSAYRATPAMRKHTELVLFNEALEKVNQAHPKWDLSGYTLIDKK